MFDVALEKWEVFRVYASGEVEVGWAWRGGEVDLGLRDTDSEVHFPVVFSYKDPLNKFNPMSPL